MIFALRLLRCFIYEMVYIMISIQSCSLDSHLVREDIADGVSSPVVDVAGPFFRAPTDFLPPEILRLLSSEGVRKVDEWEDKERNEEGRTEMRNGGGGMSKRSFH